MREFGVFIRLFIYFNYESRRRYYFRRPSPQGTGYQLISNTTKQI